jgi:hypothetical protein
MFTYDSPRSPFIRWRDKKREDNGEHNRGELQQQDNNTTTTTYKTNIFFGIEFSPLLSFSSLHVMNNDAERLGGVIYI